MELFVVGAGHVGLATGVGMAGLGHRVTVADIDATRIESLQAGVAPIFEPGLDAAIGRQVAEGRLSFTTDVRPPASAGCTIVAVSTPTGPDGPLSTTNVEAVIRSVLPLVADDHLIVVRSTLPIDGIDRLARLRADGPGGPAMLTNPEFMREGNALVDFEKPGRIVVGWVEPRDRAAAEAVLALYDGIDAPTFVADARSVALIKVATNVFLATKVAFANELARICDVVGADVGQVADGIGLDVRIQRAALTAGPGYGGSCLPEQAIALAANAVAMGIDAPLIAAVSRSNATHQAAIVERLRALLDGEMPASGAGLTGRRIGVLGLAFKANTDDVRMSPALAIVALLRSAGATVVATDPRAVQRACREDPELVAVATAVEAAAGSDALLVLTEWPEYAKLEWADLAHRMRGRVVYDTRGVVDRAAVTAAGLRYISLGRG